MKGTINLYCVEKFYQLTLEMLMCKNNPQMDMIVLYNHISSTFFDNRGERERIAVVSWFI